ncbi:MAG: glycosyltransferase family 2 protein [Deltaproteobacteria bacterium]|nr:glycosyltransferase family 2 protein [Deltaproteobacteria bacterium]MBI3294776.1 glycosyltransferase family 2 protein [Deltaproteobacteria bacterium]
MDIAPPHSLELSIVMPCLNEADTVANCVRQAFETLRRNGISGEVVVADNGSTDNSAALSRDAGARVVTTQKRGYGRALSHGIREARGRYVVFADADGSYDFSEVPTFLHALRQGFDLVHGCRLPAGNGTIMPGAMPFLHRWVGNPLLTLLARVLFGAPVHDVYCGFKGVRHETFRKLSFVTSGMEFSTELVLRMALKNRKIKEVPVTLYRDGRKNGRSHMRTIRDGLKTIAYFARELGSSPIPTEP